MHETEEQKIARRTAIVRDKFQEVLSRKEEAIGAARAARGVFYGMLQMKRWEIVEGPKPEGFEEPEEIWSETPVVR